MVCTGGGGVQRGSEGEEVPMLAVGASKERERESGKSRERIQEGACLAVSRSSKYSLKSRSSPVIRRMRLVS